MIEAIKRAVGRVVDENRGWIRGVVLIGSFARGEQLPDSDVDLVVLLSDGLRLGQRIQVMRSELWRTALQAEGVSNKVDLVRVDSSILDYEPASTPEADPLTLSDRIKLLDAVQGSYVPVHGEDFSVKLHPPTHWQLLQGIEHSLRELRSANTDPRDTWSDEDWGALFQWTFLVGVGDYYLANREWLSKHELAQRSDNALVREAWDLRTRGIRPAPGSPLLTSQSLTEWAQHVESSLRATRTQS